MNKTEIDTKFEIAEILVKHLDCDTSKVLSPLYDYLQKQLILSGVTFSSLEKILGKQTDFKLANEIKEIQAMEVFNYIVNEHNVKLTYKEWRKTVKNYYR